MAITYFNLGTVTVTSTSGADTIAFTSIPATYTDLVFQCSLRVVNGGASDGEFPRITFNSETSGTAITAYIGADGTTVYGGNKSSGEYAYTIDSGVTPSNAFAVSNFYIMDYTNTSIAKGFLIDSAYTGSFSWPSSTAGFWNSTAAITSVTFNKPFSTSSFTQFSCITLYGIQKA